MSTYRTFIRSCRDFKEFAKARKYTVEVGLTLAEARARCEAYNAARNAAQLRKGTKMEFAST